MACATNQKEVTLSILPTLPIPLDSVIRSETYKVLTMLNSGSTTNWIAEGLLEKLQYATIGSTELEVYTLMGKKVKKF